MEFLTRLFDDSGFPARWQCGTGWKETPWLGWLHILSDIGIWSAYLAIPLVLYYFLMRRRDLPFRRIFLLFAAFILACGTTHLVDAVVFWWPAYRLAAVIKLFTAIVSWSTVLALFRVIPRVTAMRTPEELEREIDARILAENELQRVNVELEQRVQERMVNLSKVVAALRDERELLHITLGSIGDGVIVTDTDNRVTFLNHVAEELSGWSAADARGAILDQVFRVTTKQAGRVSVLHDGYGTKSDSTLFAKNGVERPIEHKFALIQGANGAVRGTVVTFRDIAERRAALMKLSDQEERLRLAVEATGLGIFDYFPQTGQRDWSERCNEIWGLPREADVSFEMVLGSIHPDDRSRVRQIGERSLDPRGTGDFLMEYRVLLPDDSVKWVLTRGKTLFEGVNSHRRPVRSLGTLLDITERKLAEQALKDAHRHKDEFLAILAHELRNPLAPIRNCLELMKRAEGNPQLIEQSRITMERQMVQMVRLVDDLLDVSRISRNKLELRKERVELGSILQQAIDSCRPAIDAKRQQLSVCLPPEPIHLKADMVRLTQVFGNLLTNACKYTECEGSICLSVERSDDVAAIKVTDNGVGISDELLERIFDMFIQVDRSLERTQGGLGIGLTLVKRIVEMHGGTVTAQSAGLGCGSQFTICLPLIDEEAMNVAAVTASDDQDLFQSRRILVVDDNRDAAMTMAMLLKSDGYVVQTAYDGEEAITKASEFKPHAILLDIGLPKRNGYAVCQAIRNEPWGKIIVILALTGWGQEDDRRKSTEAGFNGHLTKPVDHAVLAKMLNEFFRNDSLASANTPA